MLRSLTLARLLAVVLPVAVVACSSEPPPVGPSAPVAQALVVSGLPSSLPAGAAHVTVTATDSSGNTVTGFAGAVHFTATDRTAALPADYTFVAADAGTHTFPVTLKTAGRDTLTVADVTHTITGRLAVTVTPGTGARLVVTGLPGTVNAGAAAYGTVVAQDSFGNIATGYTGTVHFTSTDSAAVLPADYAFGAADGGTYAFTVTLGTEGLQTVTATDVATTAISGAGTLTVVPPLVPPARDVFAVGMYGTIVHYDGTNWTRQFSDSTIRNIDGVWGTSASNVFAVGSGGTILHYDGTSWTPQVSGTTSELESVWGSSASDVFAVGAHGTILHYDGSSWTQQRSDPTGVLIGVWGSSGSDVFTVGYGGKILHYDGTSWIEQRSDSAIDLFGLWGSSATDVFAVGDSILHYDGTTWTAQRISTLFGVWGSSGHDVFAVGDYGSIMHYDGTTWTLQAAPGEGGSPWEFDGVWGSSRTDVFTVGQGGAIWHYDGTKWTEQTRVATDFLWSVWGSSNSR